MNFMLRYDIILLTNGMRTKERENGVSRKF